MEHNEPQWSKDTKAHNAGTMLNLSRFTQPLIVFGVLYWVLDSGTDFSQNIVVVLAVITAILHFLFLSWIIKKISGKNDKNNTIG